MRKDEGSGQCHVSAALSLCAIAPGTFWIEALLGPTAGLDTENKI